MTTNLTSAFFKLFVSLSLGAVCTLALAQKFPPATPESQGLDPVQVKRLSDTIQGYIDDGSMVGVEILVIKNRKTVFEKAYGWRDREDEEKMEVGSIFNIRSMTKPMTGAALQMLIEEGKVGIDDKVSKHLEEFDIEGANEITVRQLLTHRAGVPLTAYTGSLNQYDDLAALAKAVAEADKPHKPGERFYYSDAGTDCVAAIVERVSGLTVDEFIEKRLFNPLGMKDAFHVWDEERADRIVSLYGGTHGQWTRMWDASKAFYPFAWGSQTVYCTTQDYAKFLAMWMDGGMVGDKKILSEATLARGHRPISVGYAMGSTTTPQPSGFFGLATHYGEMAQLWYETPLKDGARPVVIGHGGSDGTLAYAWPEEDLIVLVFTQSRGAAGLLRFETWIDATLRGKDNVPTPEEYKPLLGSYLANFGPYTNIELVVRFLNGELTLELPLELITVLDAPDENGHRPLHVSSSAKLEFGELVEGECPAIFLHTSGQRIEIPRGHAVEMEVKPVTVEEVAKIVGKYRVPEDGSEVEVFLENGALLLRVPAANVTVPLVRIEGKPLVWLLNGQVPLEFVEEDGEIVKFVVVLPDGTRMERPKIKTPSEPMSILLLLTNAESHR